MTAERLAALRMRFIARSLEDREAIWRAIAPEAPNTMLLCGLAHRLAGGGGTVGLPAISIAAAELEEACDAGDASAIRTAARELCDLIGAAALA